MWGRVRSPHKSFTWRREFHGNAAEDNTRPSMEYGPSSAGMQLDSSCPEGTDLSPSNSIVFFAFINENDAEAAVLLLLRRYLTWYGDFMFKGSESRTFG